MLAAIALFVASIFTVYSPTASALDSSSGSSSDSSSRSAEICIRKPSEIARYPDVAQAIAGFGGLDQLEGQWKLTGLITVFAKAHVNLTHSRSGFSVEINKAYSKPYYICVRESRPDLLVLRVQNAENPGFAVITLKPGRANESLYVAAAKTGGKFIKFKRP